MRPNSLAIMEKKGNFRQEGVQSMTFFQKLAWKLQQFMTGRRGADPLCMATMILGLILTLLGQIVNGVVGVILILLGYALYFYTFFRMFSRNWQAREKENQWFLSGWRPVCAWFRMRRTIWRDRKVYKYFRCPRCHDWQRAPRGKGKIQVRCRGCSQEFFQKT